MRSVAQDLRSGIRQFRRHPGFGLVTLLCFALGVGACTTVFVVTDGMLNGSFRIPDRARLVALYPVDKSGTALRGSYPDFEDIRDGCRDVVEVYARSHFPVSISGSGQARVALAFLVSDNYFRALRVNARIGRTFATGEASRGSSSSVAVISDHLWRDAFSADPAVTGRIIQVNRRPFQVIGVAPAGFHGELAGFATDVWFPITAVNDVLPASISLDSRDTGFLDIAGRLKDGISVDRARQKLASVYEEVRKAHSPANFHQRYALEGGMLARTPHPGMARGVQSLLAALAVLVVFVLLMAGANIASLMLVHGEERRHELAARMAMGASKPRITAQLVVECLPLALCGAAAGLLLARLLLDLYSSMHAPSPVPVELTLAIGWRAILFAAGAATLTGILASLLPAVRACVVSTTEALKQGRGTVAGARHNWLQTSLVAAQVAACLGLATASGLTLRSLAWVLTADPGFDSRNLLAVHMDLKYVQYPEQQGRWFQQELLRRVRALPGVRSASMSVTTPLSFMSQMATVSGPVRSGVISDFNAVMPSYFETMNVPILSGRGITEQDVEDGDPVVVVNQSLAEELWGGADPVGHSMRVGDTVFRVVGLAKDAKYFYIGARKERYFYMPLAQNYSPYIALFVKTESAPELVLERVKQVIESLEPALPVTEARLMTEQLKLSEYPMRITALTVGSFAVLAVLLALVGLAGLVTQMAVRRTREFGLRMALGASQTEIFWQVMRQGGKVCGIGALLGLPLALGISKGMSGLLLGVSPRDPLVYTAVPLVVLGLAFAACYLPALRAAHSDPAETLRYE